MKHYGDCIEYDGYYVKHEGTTWEFGYLQNGVHMELIRVQEAGDQSLQLDTEYLEILKSRKDRNQLWRETLTSLGIERPVHSPYDFFTHLPPSFVDTPDKMIEYLRLVSRGVLSVPQIGKVTQSLIRSKLAELRII